MAGVQAHRPGSHAEASFLTLPTLLGVERRIRESLLGYIWWECHLSRSVGFLE